MNGLALARRYHDRNIGALLAPYGEWRTRIATGLVGYGSECLGFDDGISVDHDFGPGFCLWLADEDYEVIGAALQADYDRLPASFEGYGPRRTNARSGQRVGVFALSAFYAEFLGAPALPRGDADWLQIPEELLACAVSGEVFADPLGEFTRWRDILRAGYPPQARRIRLATAVAKMAQAGQYNLPRALQRGDMVAALLALAEFIAQTCRVAYVMNGQYAPIPKWLHRGIRDLPVPVGLHTKLAALARTAPQAAMPTIEDICADVLAVLIAQGHTRPGDAFLEAHVDVILQGQ